MVTTTKETRQVKRKRHRDFTKKNGQQDIFNKTLYNVIAANGGTISVPMSDLASVPANAQIKSMYVAELDAIVITAQIGKPKSKLVLPKKREVIDG